MKSNNLTRSPPPPPAITPYAMRTCSKVVEQAAQRKPNVTINAPAALPARHPNRLMNRVEITPSKKK